MSKTIQINPDLFKISKSNTRKKAAPKIELKSAVKTQKQKTLRKNVLKMIREKQQEAYRELFDKKKLPKPPDKKKDELNSSSFDSSLEFFSSLSQKPNGTLKQYPAPVVTTSPIPFIPPPISIAPNIPPLTNIIDVEEPVEITQPPLVLAPTPKFGCLKNGSLPTYRTYTRKNYVGGTPPTTTVNSSFMTNSNPIYTDNPFDVPLLSNNATGGAIGSGGLGKITPKFIEQSQKFDKIHRGKVRPSKAELKIKYKKRKKIFKRTYRIGRSKKEPVVGVLVSNKTIRNRISTEAQLLKQTPIQEVRRFLIKKGFIKVGTNAPNDVLRKMYETVSLVCGEIQNHNPENLLYNFMNDKE
jgi:hypothetical protein